MLNTVPVLQVGIGDKGGAGGTVHSHDCVSVMRTIVNEFAIAVITTLALPPIGSEEKFCVCVSGANKLVAVPVKSVLHQVIWYATVVPSANNTSGF